MSKKIQRLRKTFYVEDEHGRSDKPLVIKVNELIEVVNRLQEENEKLKKKLGVK